jgi:rhodanese-like protein
MRFHYRPGRGLVGPAYRSHPTIHRETDMSSQSGSGVRDLTPQEVAQGMKDGRVVLVDVREPNETAVERFPGAVLVPLSAFDPVAIPAPPACEVVFACRSGRRRSPRRSRRKSKASPTTRTSPAGFWRGRRLDTKRYDKPSSSFPESRGTASARFPRYSRPFPAIPDCGGHRPFRASSSSFPRTRPPPRSAPWPAPSTLHGCDAWCAA